MRAYLEALEARDIGNASGLLADGFAMTFPGAAVFRSLEELVAERNTRRRPYAIAGVSFLVRASLTN